MKKRVSISTYGWIISICSTILLLAGFVSAIKQQNATWVVCLIGAAIALLFLSVLFYMPLSISVDSESLNINRSLRIKSIPLSEIKSVELFSPTLNRAIKICGSSGWFGWYGWFKDREHGKYFAYYGDNSNCFLVTLHDGKKYAVGCNDAPMMVDEIKKLISLST